MAVNDTPVLASYDGRNATSGTKSPPEFVRAWPPGFAPPASGSFAPCAASVTAG